MPSLFIANTSKQNQIFNYRLPEHPIPKYVDIRVGTQVKIPGDLSPEAIKAIIEHATPYGLKAVNELPRNRDFVGLCYSINEPVKLDHLYSTFEQNDVVLNEKAEERREDQAAIIAQEIQNSMHEVGVEVPRAEVTMVEETKDTPRVANGYEVTAPGVAPKHGGKPGRRSDQR
jgi:hypothetical protein